MQILSLFFDGFGIVQWGLVEVFGRRKVFGFVLVFIE